ncbi:hypothetical protein H5410_012962 [Solanum commersonii]|uniref:Autophagy-related protein n=1 Tax=Solanum commersonii TaxID=4109 RepID=A0A9J6AT66_SOLCO|nr:hypothetical protein H5410_012962 [Solanum commersonii]
MGKTFKDEFSYEERLSESRDIIAKYPDRVPVAHQIEAGIILHLVLSLASTPASSQLFRASVVAERYSKTDLPEMEKKK